MEQIQVLYCIPNYNNGRFLPDLFTSIEADIQAGTFAASILLLNDGCSDDSAAIATAYQASNKVSMNIIVTATATGEGAARSFLLQRAHSFRSVDYLRCVDADDVVPAGSTEAMILHAQKHSLVGVSGQFEVFGDETGDRKYFPLEHDEIIASIRRINSFATACALIDARVAREANLDVNPKWKFSADYPLLLNLAALGRLGNLQQSVLLYRKHPGANTQQSLRKVSSAFLRVVFENWKNPVYAKMTFTDFQVLGRKLLLVATPQFVHPTFVAAKAAVLKLKP